jgi:chitinase
VGGATYTDYKSANFQAAADLVEDLGLDGIDIDFEPNSSVCTWATGGHSCPADADLIWLIRSYRKALPRPKLLTVAGWSTGAFGGGDFPASKFPSKIIGANFGLFINSLKTVGTLLDGIFIMSYDASSDYLPKTALDAYRSLYKGPLLLGVEVPPEAGGGHQLTLQELDDFNNYVKSHGGQGIMLWSLQKQGNPSPTQVGQSVCRSFGLKDCNGEIPSN